MRDGVNPQATAMPLPAKLLLLVALSLSSFTPQAQTERKSSEQMPPRYFTVGTFSSDTTLKFDCELITTTEVACDVLMVAVRRMTDDQKAKAKAELAQLDTASDLDIQNAIKTFAAFDAKTLQRRRSQATPAQAAYLADFLTAIQAAQAATDRRSLKAAIAKMNGLEENSCRISFERIGRPTFQRVGPNRWLSNPGPQGLCNVVTVQILESSSEHQLLWKLTQTTVSAETERPSCRFLKNTLNKPEVYSWDYPKNLSPGCKYLTVD